MHIIVEGPDNAGKTTLIRFLRAELGLQVVPGEGPAISEEEINDRVQRYLTYQDNMIFDRHPCVSHPIYNSFRTPPINLDPHLIAEFYARTNLFIFCRGNGVLEGHNVRDVDARKDGTGRSHEQLVNQHHGDICQLYDEWGLKHAHISYRIGDDMRRVADFVKSTLCLDFDPVRDIAEFHMKFGLTYDGPPRVLPVELADFRKRFMDEELDEYAKHEARASSERFVSAIPDVANYSFHLEQMLDALVDETYVVLGTAYLHGFDFREAWRRVHAANMKKVRAQRASDSKRGSAFDVVKPKGWEPPSHIDLVENNDLSR